MRILTWILVWLLLLAWSAWYLWRRLKWLGRATGRLGAQVAQAEGVLSRIQREAAGATRDGGQPQAVTGRAPAGPGQPLAVFTTVPQAVAERRAVRRALIESKRARRLANLPRWARRVDSDPT